MCIRDRPNIPTLLSEYLGTDLSRISNELNKLKIILKEGEVLDETIIETNIGISKDFNVFELIKALGKKDEANAFKIAHFIGKTPKQNPFVTVSYTHLDVYKRQLNKSLSSTTVTDTLIVVFDPRQTHVMTQERLAVSRVYRYRVEFLAPRGRHERASPCDACRCVRCSFCDCQHWIGATIHRHEHRARCTHWRLRLARSGDRVRWLVISTAENDRPEGCLLYTSRCV